MKLHHLGIAVPSIEAAAPWWQQVCQFRRVSEVVYDPIQEVRVQFFKAVDGFCVELIEPASESSPVSCFLAEQGGGLYHLCFEVKDLDATVAKWRESGAFPVKKPEPAVAFGGQRIVFLVTPQRILVELVESPRLGNMK